MHAGKTFRASKILLVLLGYFCALASIHAQLVRSKSFLPSICEDLRKACKKVAYPLYWMQSYDRKYSLQFIGVFQLLRWEVENNCGFVRKAFQS